MILAMLEQLIKIDQSWLLAINGCHSAWADSLMWLISGKLTWLPLYALLIALVIWRFGWKQALIVLAGFGFAVGLADYLSSGVIKHLVCRPRPTHEPELEGMLHIVNGYRGGAYGFVSSHAANTMSCALLFCLVYIRRLREMNLDTGWRKTVVWGGLILWVAANCYSRMYLGVHYPGDIIGGLAVGSLTAAAVNAVLCRIEAGGWWHRCGRRDDAAASDRRQAAACGASGRPACS